LSELCYQSLGFRSAGAGGFSTTKLRGGARGFARILAVIMLAAASGAVTRVDIGGDRNAAYLAAVRGGGLQAEIVYMDPSQPIEIDEAPAKPPKASPPENPQAVRWLLIAVAAVSLALITILVIRNGAGGKAIFAKRLRPERDDARSRAPQPEPTPASGLHLLARIAALADRRLALQELTEHSLDRATRANGLRLGRSQTARDVLAYLSPAWRHHGALRLIVDTEEAVRFGGAPLGDANFADCLAAIRPLFAEHGPA
jgi:hypothetical protein